MALDKSSNVAEEQGIHLIDRCQTQELVFLNVSVHNLGTTPILYLLI